MTQNLHLLFRARSGHEVFAVLTHVDAYTPDDEDDSDAEDEDPLDEENEEHFVEQSGERSPEAEGNNETESGSGTAGEGSGFDRETDMAGILSLW